MKNKIYYLGLFICIIITLGALLKIMHWPGAGIALIAGIISLILVFMPMAFKSCLKTEDRKRMKTFYVLAGIILSIDFISLLFTLMHWPGSRLLMFISIPLPFVILLPVYLWANRKEEEIKYNQLLAILFFFAYLSVMNALSAVGVSEEVIRTYLQSANKYEQNAANIKEQSNYILLKTFTDTTLFEKGKLIKTNADLTYQKIEELKKMLIVRYQFKDSKIDIAQNYLNESQKALESFTSSIRELLKSIPNNEAHLEKLIELLPKNDHSWALKIQNSKILISAIDQLCYTQYMIRLVEFETLIELH
jgi:hypothetical protein